MKKCPYCSAELLDNADFCLYCMRSLDKKRALNHTVKKPYLKYAVIGVSVFLLIGGISAFTVLKFRHKPKQKAVFNQENTSDVFLPNKENPETGSENISGYNNSLTQSNRFAAAKNEASSENTSTGSADTSDYSTAAAAKSTGSSSSGSGSGSKYEASEISKSEKSHSSASSKSDAISNPDSSDEQPITSSSDGQTDKPAQTWEIRDLGSGIEITGIETYNSTGNYEIPSQINGKNVVGIGFRAFYYERAIKSIILPETLTYIGDQAFAYCDALGKIIIPRNVTKIGVNAFSPCSNLSAVYIASKNISIGSYAFSNTYNRSVNLTIYAPAAVMDKETAKALWSADYKEWNG